MGCLHATTQLSSQDRHLMAHKAENLLSGPLKKIFDKPWFNLGNGLATEHPRKLQENKQSPFRTDSGKATRLKIPLLMMTATSNIYSPTSATTEVFPSKHPLQGFWANLLCHEGVTSIEITQQSREHRAGQTPPTSQCSPSHLDNSTGQESASCHFHQQSYLADTGKELSQDSLERSPTPTLPPPGLSSQVPSSEAERSPSWHFTLPVTTSSHTQSMLSELLSFLVLLISTQHRKASPSKDTLEGKELKERKHTAV